MIDVDHHLGAADRRVGTRTPPAGQVRVVTVARTFDAPVDDVWDACTSPERIRRWFLPVTGELRVGGRYQLEGHAGGVVERCDPPDAGPTAGFAVTWEHSGDVSHVEVHLTSGPDGGTVLTLDHLGHTDDAFWTEFGPGAVGVGWELGLLGLAGHVDGHDVPSPEDGPAWAASAQGRRFTTDSSDAWCAAHVAAGADPAAARAAADRTTAAYTGTPDPASQI